MFIQEDCEDAFNDKSRAKETIKFFNIVRDLIKLFNYLSRICQAN